MNLQFEWDSEKADKNAAKHGVDFHEAATVFRDRLAAIFDDDWHSDEEHREIIIGYSAKNRLLIVIFTQRGASIRIISARKATRREVQAHENRHSRSR